MVWIATSSVATVRNQSKNIQVQLKASGPNPTTNPQNYGLKFDQVEPRVTQVSGRIRQR